MLDRQRRRELAELREMLLLASLNEEDEQQLHYHHGANRHVALPPKLQKLHDRGKDASRLATDIAHDWPEDQKAFLHKKAAEVHANTAHELHQQGFHALGNQHDQWAQHHEATAHQHAPAHKARLIQSPPGGGHAHSGHTLPAEQPAHVAAQEQGHQWNAQHGSYQPVPKKAAKASERATGLSHVAHAAHGNERVSPVDKVASHQKAMKAHVKAAGHFKEHGFHGQAHHHEQMAAMHMQAMGQLRGQH